MRLFLSILLVCTWLSLSAQSISHIESLIAGGKYEAASSELSQLESESKRRTACQLFLKTKKMNHRTEIVSGYTQIINDYAGTWAASEACIELGKIYFLARDYQQATKYLQKIKDESCYKKDYWLGQVYLHAQNTKKAISHLQSYLELAGNTENTPSAMLLLAEASEKDNNFAKALLILRQLKSAYPQWQKALILYKTGLSSESMENYTGAVLNYRLLLHKHPYSRYAYLAEDRLYSIKKEKKADIEVGGELIQTSDETKAIEGISSFFDNGNAKKNTSSLTTIDTVASVPRLQFYLQAGAFSARKNAEKLKKSIAKYNFESIVYTKLKNGKLLSVVAVGPFVDKKAAQSAKNILNKKNISTFVIKR